MRVVSYWFLVVRNSKITMFNLKLTVNNQKTKQVAGEENV